MSDLLNLKELQKSLELFKSKNISKELYIDLYSIYNSEFFTTNSNIYKLFNASKKDKEYYYIKNISTYFKVKTAIQDFISNDRKYKVELFNGKEIIEKIYDSSILTKTGISKLFESGCIFDDNNYKDILQYIAISAYNAKVIMNHSKLGWQLYNGKMIFLSYKCFSNDNSVISNYSGDFNIAPQGSLDTWLNMIKQEVIGNVSLTFGMLLGFSGIILGYLNIYLDLGNLLFNYCGLSSKGKTTVAMLATSVYSNPSFNKGTLTTFNSTANALLSFVSETNSHTVAIDEIGSKDITLSRSFFYQICSGQEKLRLNKNTEFKDRKSFNSIIITTAEFYILGETDPDGLRVRIFELADDLTTSAKNSDNIKETVLKNYGVAGEKFTEFIINNMDNILNDYENIKLELLNNYKDIAKRKLTDRILSKLAVILLTANYVQKCFNINCYNNDIIKYIISIERNITEEVTVTENLMNYVLEYISKNKSKFITEYTYETSCSSVEGKIVQKDNFKEIYILKSVFEGILKSNHFENQKEIIKKLKEENILIPEKDRPCKRIVLTKKGTKVPCYLLKILDEPQSKSKICTPIADTYTTLQEKIKEISLEEIEVF